MSYQTPIFPFPAESHQHFNDYGFDRPFDYFQVLEEARKHKRESHSRSKGAVDSVHLKLQKPISNDESSKKIKKNKKRWWRNALLFFKGKWPAHARGPRNASTLDYGLSRRGVFRGSKGPLYITDSRSGSSAPYLTTSRPSSGPLAGTLTPAEKGEIQIPYISLREINMDQSASSVTPIYLVT